MRTVAVSLKLQVADYVANAKKAAEATQKIAAQQLSLATGEAQFKAAVDQASAALKANGQTLDKTTAQGKANRAALDQIARSARTWRNALIEQGASQEAVNAATAEGKAQWTAAASAMGMTEAKAARLSKTLFSTSQVLRQHSSELSSLAMSLGIAGAAMAAPAVMAVKSFADFDRQMSAVSATGEDAKNSLDGLREAAVKAGADTMFSATEAADGIKELLKAGITADDVLRGGLAGALDLAAAGSMSVGDAAEVTATALAQFGLDGSQASHVADLLAAGANEAKGEVSDLAMALAQGGLVAHQTGLSVDETVAALTAFATAGMLGSDSGTSLKTMLQRLTPQSAQAAAQFDELGISAWDAQGRFVGLANFAGQLHQQMKDLTPEARNAAMQIMFGADAVRGANVLYEAGAGKIQEYMSAVNQQGYAQKFAREMTNNLAGDLERLGGSIDTVFIKSGSGANDMLRRMAQSTEELVNWIGQIPAPVLNSLTMITGSGGLAVLGVAGISKLAGTFMDAAENARKLGLNAKAAKGLVGGLSAGLVIGSIAVEAWLQQQATAKQTTQDLAATLVVLGDQVTTTAGTVDVLKQKIIESRVGLFGWTGDLTTYADRIGLTYSEMVDYIEQVPEAIDKVEAKFAAYSKSTNGWGADDITYARDALNALQESQKAAVWVAKEQAKADEQASTSATTYLEALTKKTKSTDDATKALKDYSAELFNSANAALKASGTQIGWEASLDDTRKAIEKTGKAQQDANGYLDLNREKGRQNMQALNQLAQSSVAYAQTLIEQGASEKRVQDELDRSRKSFIDQAVAAGMSKTAAKDLADAYGLIPGDVKTNISVTGGDKSATKLALVQAAIADLPAEQQVEVLSAFDDGGVKAADAALEAINGKHVTAYVEVQEKYVKAFNKSRQGGQKLAEGGLFEQFMGSFIRQFASGGLARQFADGGEWGQPQVRAFQGDAGVQWGPVNWGEQGSGPWEAFISGAPQKRERSLAIWREVGRRLLGQFSARDIMAGFAEGGIAEPQWNGKPLSYWQNELKTPLELTRLKIQIRDLEKSLKERETYKDHGRKRTRYRLRGLDRTEAQQQLAESRDEMKQSMLAKQLNESKAGTIQAQIDAYEAQKDAAQAVQDAASSLMDQYMTGSSWADLVANMNAGAVQMADFQNGLARLQNQGLDKNVLDYLGKHGSADLIGDIAAKGRAGIDALNGAASNLSTSANSLGAAQSSGNYTPSTFQSVQLPGYWQSGAVVAGRRPRITASRSASRSTTPTRGPWLRSSIRRCDRSPEQRAPEGWAPGPTEAHPSAPKYQDRYQRRLDPASTLH